MCRLGESEVGFGRQVLSCSSNNDPPSILRNAEISHVEQLVTDTVSSTFKIADDPSEGIPFLKREYPPDVFSQEIERLLLTNYPEEMYVELIPFIIARTLQIRL